MDHSFIALSDPSREQCAGMLSAWAAVNPFYTFNYLQAQRLLGYQPWIFMVKGQDRRAASCTGFMKSGRFSKHLSIASLPTTAEERDIFWQGVLRFCRQHHISHLDLNTYASTGASIPALPGEIRRRERWEYLLELQSPELWSHLSANHVRNIKKGIKNGLRMRRTTDASAARVHAELVFSSRERREERGETTPKDSPVHEVLAILQSGAGELFQAVGANDEPLSSLLILIAERSAYYHSAGTSREGMAGGASHFLIQQVANTLREQSIEYLNLGGTDQTNPGLSRFKSGFGARAIQLEAAECFLGSKIRRKLLSGIRALRNEPLHHFKKLLALDDA